MSPCLCTAEAQPVTAQKAFLRLHLQGFIHFGQQLSPFTAGQKTVVTYHLKMLLRDMTDIASDHLFLGQRLLAVLLRAVVVIMVHHGTAAVVPELRRLHRWSLQVPAQVFDASPGPPGFLCEVHFSVASVLCIQITAPLFLIPDDDHSPADWRA